MAELTFLEMNLLLLLLLLLLRNAENR